MKKDKNKTLKRKLDKLWGLIIRSKGACELCQRQGKTDAHHLEGRSPMALRWDLRNGINLCFRCHRLGVHSPASSVQAEFRQKIIELRGIEVMEELKRMRYQFNKVDLEETYKNLDEIYNNN